MRELALLTFVTLDGVMQAPKMPEEDWSGGFDQGGWADPYWDEVMELVGREAMAEPYDALFGRKTFDMFAAHASDDHPMNSFKKIVATSKSDELGWQNSTAITGDIPAEVARLKQQDGPLLQVHGSWQLIQTLLSHDLVDELRLWTFPLVAGRGKRLFERGSVASKFSLVKTDNTSNGVIMGIYRRRA
ncbi:MAG: dihydrofolate reductase [Alphaproteobacteria bacterium]|nr:dihydrofolate reductase [Alphaproteobacteria bacterium]